MFSPIFYLRTVAAKQSTIALNAAFSFQSGRVILQKDDLRHAKMRKAHIPPGIALLSILLAASGEYAIVIGHYWAQFNGVVVARTNDVHFPSWTRNRANRYVIREADGSEHVYYADSSEGHRDGFPIGTSLVKQRWRMDYQENGETRNDFPLSIYILPMLLDSVLLGACAILVIMIQTRDRQNQELHAAFERARRRLETEDGEDQAQPRAH
jgi:hypothetical protein